VFTTTYAAFATANYVGQLTQEGPHVRGRGTLAGHHAYE